MEAGESAQGPQLLLADDYRIEPYGAGFMGSIIVEENDLDLDRSFYPFSRGTLPEELARLSSEEDALTFAQRNGFLAYDEAEPVEFVLHEARKARLVMALMNAVQIRNKPPRLPWATSDRVRLTHVYGLIEERVRDLIGNESYEAIHRSAGGGHGRDGVRPVWREYPKWSGKPEGGLTGDAALVLETLIMASPVDIACMVICDTLNAPAMGVPYLRDRKTRGGVTTYLAPGPQLLARGVNEARFLTSWGLGDIKVISMTDHVLGVVRWWFQQELSSGREVRQCVWCKNYFFVYDGRQRYCRRPAGDPGPADESPCAIAARGKRFRGRRSERESATESDEKSE